MLSTDQKGAIAETAIIHEATKLGIGVFTAINDGSRYDLVFDVSGRLLRVQCKWANRDGDVVVVRCCSCRRSRHGMIKRNYSADEVAAFAAYCADLDRCYFMLFEQLAGESGINLRLTPPRNNQRSGINWAEAYEFGATLGRDPGAIAQLGERLRGTQEVGGSSPPGSTSGAPAHIVGAHEFREHFGWYLQCAAAGEEIAVTRHGKATVRLVAAR